MATQENITNIFDCFIQIFQNPQDRVNALISVFKNLGYDDKTQTIVPTQDDKSAVIFRCYCLAYIAYTVPSIEFESSSEALELIKTLNALFEAELKDTAISGETFGWLARLKTKIIADISTRGSIQPKINTFICEMLPIPVVSQYLYQTGTRADEILIRNNAKIRHPLFYTGSLEVLSS